MDEISAGYRYDAFISYSHAVDGRLAPALQRALQAFAKPWYRMRALHLFRDESTLSVTPGLWTSIQDGLAGSRAFILLASPEAARSAWVGREVTFWCEHKPLDQLYLVLTDGEIVWDDVASDFDPRSTAVPPALQGAFAEEPLWVDLAWARRSEDLSLNHPAFRDAVAEIAAALRGVPKDELVGEEVRQHRRTRRLARSAVALLALFGIAAATLGGFALVQRNAARAERDQARSRELGAAADAQQGADPELSVILASRAVDAWRTDQAVEALRLALVRSHVRAQLPVPGGAESVSFSPTRRLLATAARDGEVGFWRLDGRKLAALRVPGGVAEEVVFSRDGTLVAARTATRARVWNVRTRRLLASVAAGSDQSFSHMALGPRGRLVTTTFTGPARIWDGHTGALLGTLPGRGGAVDRAGKRVLMFGPGGGVIWSTVRRQRVARLPPAYQFEDGAFTPHDVLLVTWGSEGARSWSARDGDLHGYLHGFEMPAPPNQPAWAFSYDDRVIIERLAAVATRNVLSESGGGATLLGSKEAEVWNARSSSDPIHLRGHTGIVWSIAFAPTGHLLLTGAGDGTARLWNAATGKQLLVLRGHHDLINAVDFSPDGRLVATADTDGTARVWDAQPTPPATLLRSRRSPLRHAVASSEDGALAVVSGNTVAHLVHAHGRQTATLRGSGRVTSAAFSADGRRLITATGDSLTASGEGPARLWTTDGRLATILRGENGPIYGVALDPTASLAAVGGEGARAAIFDARSGRLLRRLTGHTDRVLGVAFSPDGKTLVTASRDGTARLWSAQTGRLLQVLNGHRDSVLAAAFSPGSDLVATVGADDTARVWIASSGRELLRFPARGARSVRFGADGTRVLTTSADGSTWAVRCEACASVDALIRLARRRITRPLSPDEQARYLP